MSYGKFICELPADERLRRWLLWGGVFALLLGCLLIVAIPVSTIARIALMTLWTTSSFLELRGLRRGMSRICRIRIQPDGRVEAVDRAGDRQPLEVLAGSVVLARMAWLRVRFADGQGHGEWLSRGRAGAGQWRYFQLIWRQRAGFFGRSE